MFYHLTLQTQGVPSPRNAARSVRSRYLGGQPVFNLASPSHKVELRKGFVLWVLVFPRPYNTKTKKNSKNKAHIFRDQTLSPKLSDHSIVVHCLTTPMHCAVLCLVTQSCPPLWDPIDCSPPGSFVHGNSPGKNNEVGCHVFLQGIFPTQGSNPGLPHCRWIFYHLSPWILEWISYPFFRGSSRLRNQTGVFCIAGRFFTSWATREAPYALTGS